MSLKISKPGDSLNKKPKLTPFGKLMVGIGCAVICILIIVAAVMFKSADTKAEKDKLLMQTVERSIGVCQNSLDTLRVDKDAMAVFEEYKDNISEQKKPLSKAKITLDLIGFTLKYADGNQSITDELNGTRNRMYLAIKEYEK